MSEERNQRHRSTVTITAYFDILNCLGVSVTSVTDGWTDIIIATSALN